MVHEVSTSDYSKYRELFNEPDFPQTWIESAFEFGSGKLFVDVESNPSMSVLLYPYHVFIVGSPDTSDVSQMLDLIPDETEIHVVGEEWRPRLKEHFEKTLYNKRRFKLSHESLSLDNLAHLKKPLPDGYSVERVDRETAQQLPQILQVHIPPYFGSVDSFMEKGIGFCVKHGDKPISMASSCIPYTGKLEVQIATVDSTEYRRRGFGTIVAISLLEYCLKNNIEPYWDATNEPSAIMAGTLGYTDSEEYYVYKLIKTREP